MDRRQFLQGFSWGTLSGGLSFAWHSLPPLQFSSIAAPNLSAKTAAALAKIQTLNTEFPYRFNSGVEQADC